jgi:hypothetical protein
VFVCSNTASGVRQVLAASWSAGDAAGTAGWGAGRALCPSLASSDLFMQELALNERLDAMIDRAIKRLIQIKAMKQMLRQDSPERRRSTEEIRHRD